MRPGLQRMSDVVRGMAVRREEAPRQRRGTGPGLERWMLSLMREVGHGIAKAPEPARANVALHDLAW
jgi:hypothetical protein